MKSFAKILVSFLLIATLFFSCGDPSSGNPNTNENPGSNNPEPTNPDPGPSLNPVSSESQNSSAGNMAIKLTLTGGTFKENLSISQFSLKRNNENINISSATVKRLSDTEAMLSVINFNGQGYFSVNVSGAAQASQATSLSASPTATLVSIKPPKNLKVEKSLGTTTRGQIYITASEDVYFEYAGKYLTDFNVYWSESETGEYRFLTTTPPSSLISLIYYQKDVLEVGKTYFYKASALYPQGETEMTAAVPYTHQVDGDALSLTSQTGSNKEWTVTKTTTAPGYVYFNFPVVKGKKYNIEWKDKNTTGSSLTGNIKVVAHYDYATNGTAIALDFSNKEITATKDGYIILTVTNKFEGSGTFQISYNIVE